jgi:hypothetical protein
MWRARTFFCDTRFGVERVHDDRRVSDQHEAPRLIHFRARVLQHLLRALQLLHHAPFCVFRTASNEECQHSVPATQWRTRVGTHRRDSPICNAAWRAYLHHKRNGRVHAKDADACTNLEQVVHAPAEGAPRLAVV